MSEIEKNPLEWVVFGISLVIIGAVIGFLVYMGFTGGDSPPVIDVRLGSAQEQNGHFAVPVTIENLGDEVAETVTVEVELLLPSGQQETGSFEVDYLPRDASRNGWVTFTTDPAEAESVEIRVPGYKEP